jgi:hypothetical protein
LTLVEAGAPDEVADAIIWHREAGRSFSRLTSDEFVHVTR